LIDLAAAPRAPPRHATCHLSIYNFDHDDMMMDESNTAIATADETTNQPSHTPEAQNGGTQDRTGVVARMDAVGQLDDAVGEQQTANARRGGEGDDDDDDDVLRDIPVHHKRNGYPDDDIDRIMGQDSPNGTYNGSPGRRTGRQAFDIEMDGGDDDDAEYGVRRHRQHGKAAVCCLSKYCCPCLPPCYKIGNATVIIPPLYEKTGRYGVIGPHWPGLAFTFGLLWSASYYYTNRAFAFIGPISGGISVVMTAVCTALLCAVAFADPGMITSEGQERANGNDVGGKYAGLPTDGRDLSDWRYCDLCSVYQPPTAAHCPDCNLCIDGYDHHCPWMGTCIGKRNMKAFVSFNLSWMFYLFYSVAWVSFGPMVSGNTAWQEYVGNATEGDGVGHNVTGNHSFLI